MQALRKRALRAVAAIPIAWRWRPAAAAGPANERQHLLGAAPASLISFNMLVISFARLHCRPEASVPDVLVRGLDPVVIENAKLAARERGISVGRLLAEAITERFSGGELPAYDDLDGLAGTWSAADLKAFEAAVAPLTAVEPELWVKRRRSRR
jgi:hypothetical protein